MSNIYQDIWNSDQEYAGLKAIRPDTEITEELKAHGYIVVNEDKGATADTNVIQHILIPENKQETYKLTQALFNNYTLDQTKPETDFEEETREVQQFLEFIHKCPPMEIARNYVEQQSGASISTDQWWAILQRIWFERFDQGKNRDFSGFEHIVVGEQKQGKVQGYHWWYKYFMDEHFRKNDADDTETDLIKFIRWKNTPEDQSPEVVTLSYLWRAFDYEAQQFRQLSKPIGGFWVGPSIAGLLALGTVRAIPEAMAPKQAVINGLKYNLPVYRSPNDRHLRTFYPEFAGIAQQ